MTAAKKSTRRLAVLAAGGTGGHLFPAKALAQALLARGWRVALITDERGGGFGPDLPQVEVYRISAAGLAGGSVVRKLRGFAKLAYGTFEAWSRLGRLKPAVAVGFGGYPSVPTILAAHRRRIPIVLHEQNQIAGRANRLLAGRAKAIGLSFPETSGLESAAGRLRVTGNPVRAAIAAVGRKPFALPGKDDRLRLLVTGGSQGARVFNELLPKALCRLPAELKRRLLVAQQVRGDDLEAVAETYRGCGIDCDLRSFFDDMPERLAAAHLLVCRAGASTVSELAAAGRPAILVPYPYAADDHQTGNAHAFARAGGGWVMPQHDLTPERLAERVAALLSDPGTLARASTAARAFAEPDAAERLADLVADALDGDGQQRPADKTGKEAAA
ncbi:UDP-N-acetylglucosamine-N-acetylmuramylpentapeptide N-acetylglucosamine transferase [Tistlia consotensis]|uniref:UDP-N-acetylglucosamine--N-acetylmuramyl-(pentapeptide) pyrophosphoryl-undecaprenol N-acetylglucosamine transferase n=1 Tax=Tistlia consotensis USBA 355 TaxID=560819 RepID=A0A1Y6CLB3_9PROT|nr:undecaprenyldiphospho-muramoylpentapeptide beta-N-acetylglucosaminyltransferase [Tistlia consotensis]SMF71016.1 UDP-N-acetylglucosamine-N-acetylmuramylpentapeptide N-acetylglucosamine transferase [Tistlia consotensis USBA 355]SNS06979.1 UDP-N-acetylglucosamine-N-acetylmuramylpentapeptide N-acetylglucosamine transferase [Tistlia consotensis]